MFIFILCKTHVFTLLNYARLSFIRCEKYLTAMLMASHVSMTTSLLSALKVNLITLVECLQLRDVTIDVTLLVVWEVLCIR